jgi:shikimate dehydrogenase
MGYCLEMVKGTTQILGIIGDPVAHSLSPLMHNAAFAEMGVDYAYLPFPVAPENLQTAVQGLRVIANVQGFNVTIPHKEEIVPCLGQVTDIARAVGAVNTVKRLQQGWVGTNTDVAGFLAPLARLERDWSQTPVLVLGSGGAARAVVVACWQLGCPTIHVMGRDPRKMRRFYSQMTAQLEALNLRVHPWQSVESILEVVGLVVNATPLGMAEQPASPLTVEQLKLLPPGAIAYDLIYTPRPTQFLRLAEQAGCVVIDGLEMLLHQGCAALEFWLERPAPVETMRRALLTAFHG